MNREPWQVTADLLRLRRWALSVLIGNPQSLPEVDNRTLDLFLRLERCAAALAENLGPDVNPVIGAAAARETQVYLAAQVDGGELEDIASETDAPIVVLKGGVHALRRSRPTLPLSDIDILVDQSRMSEILNLLESHHLGDRTESTARHTAVVAEDSLRIEVHCSLEGDGSAVSPQVWSRIRPLSDTSRLHRLAARDNLLYVLDHAVLSHGNQSVAIRDSILIGLCAMDCSPDELALVRSDIERDPAAGHLEKHLDFAIALVRGEHVADPFEQSCATSYAAAAITPGLPSPIRSSSAVAFAVERELARVSWSWSLRNAATFIGTGVTSLSSIASRYPRMARAVIRPAHVAYHNIVAVVVRPMIRSTARRAIASIR
jgi:hypothetical protein